MEWNVVVTIHTGSLARAFRVLSKLGDLKKTAFFNVLVMRTDDITRMTEALSERWARDPDSLSFLSRLIPVTHTFTFQTPEEFQKKAADSVLQWIAQLGGKSFHVRMHRRGFRGRMASPDEERFLDHVILDALEKAGTPSRITFEGPAYIVAVETVGQQAGLSLWSREDLQRYPFLGLD